MLGKINPRWAFAAGLMLVAGGPASAQGTGDGNDARPGNWDYTAGLYLWVPVSISGTSTVNGVDAPVDLGFDDILEMFEGGISGRFEAWNRSRWGIVVDGYYANLGSEVQTFGPRFEADIREGIVDLLGAYRLTPESDGLAGGIVPGPSETAVDIMLGGRYHYLRHDWVELAVGARVQWGVNERWSTALRGDLSGFGIGDASNLTYNFWAPPTTIRGSAGRCCSGATSSAPATGWPS